MSSWYHVHNIISKTQFQQNLYIKNLLGSKQRHNMSSWSHHTFPIIPKPLAHSGHWEYTPMNENTEFIFIVPLWKWSGIEAFPGRFIGLCRTRFAARCQHQKWDKSWKRCCNNEMRYQYQWLWYHHLGAEISVTFRY